MKCAQILVHGSREAATSLANFCRNARDIVQGRVFVPRLNEIVDATTESHIFQVWVACCYMVSPPIPKMSDGFVKFHGFETVETYLIHSFIIAV